MDKKSTAYADALATGLFALGKVDLIKKNIKDNSIPALIIFKGNEKFNLLNQNNGRNCYNS